MSTIRLPCFSAVSCAARVKDEVVMNTRFAALAMLSAPKNAWISFGPIAFSGLWRLAWM